MARDRRERLVENLAVASALGFLALVIAVISLAADAREAAQERSALSAGAGDGLSLAGRARDPSFDRFFQVQGEAGATFAVVLALRSADASALVAARFSAKGELRELRLLGSPSSRLPADPKELAAAFPGADESLRRAAQFARRLPGGDLGGGS